ncbi:MAG: IS200/IS605 family transposase [Candidatus Atabeyarchaeum deiterrae]
MRASLQAGQFQASCGDSSSKSFYAKRLSKGSHNYSPYELPLRAEPQIHEKTIDGENRPKAGQLIYEKAKQLECKVIQLRIVPDHVHLFTESNPKLSPNRVIGEIKGYTSRVPGREFRELLKMPTLWTRSYLVSTTGNVSSRIIEPYTEV